MPEPKGCGHQGKVVITIPVVILSASETTTCKSIKGGSLRDYIARKYGDIGNDFEIQWCVVK